MHFESTIYILGRGLYIVLPVSQMNTIKLTYYTPSIKNIESNWNINRSKMVLSGLIKLKQE